MNLTLNRREFVFGSAGVAAAMALTGCGGDGADSSASVGSAGAEKREYISNDEIDALFTNPDEYKGKWVKLPGKTLGSSETQDGVTAFQAYYDITTYDCTYIVHCATDESYGDGEYVWVDGKVDGTFSGENMMGATLEVPLIVDATVTKSTYVDVVAPATATSEPAVSATQNDVTFTCDKVEYAKVETRIQLTVSNPTANGVSYGLYSICLLVNGQQVDQDSSSGSAYEGEYPELSYDLTAGANTTGILVFPPMDPAQAFQIVIPDIYSDDYNIQFSNITLDIPAAQ